MLAYKSAICSADTFGELLEQLTQAYNTLVSTHSLEESQIEQVFVDADKDLCIEYKAKDLDDKIKQLENELALLRMEARHENN